MRGGTKEAYNITREKTGGNKREKNDRTESSVWAGLVESEIDCSAITIRCIQPWRRRTRGGGATTFAFGAISVSAFSRISRRTTRGRIGAVHTCPPSPITNADFSSNEATCGHVCATILAKRNQASWPLCAGHNTHRVTYHSFSTTRENSAFLQSTVLHLSILSLNRTWRLDLAHGFAHGLAIANRS